MVWQGNWSQAKVQEWGGGGRLESTVLCDPHQNEFLHGEGISIPASAGSMTADPALDFKFITVIVSNMIWGGERGVREGGFFLRVKQFSIFISSTFDHRPEWQRFFPLNCFSLIHLIHSTHSECTKCPEVLIELDKEPSWGSGGEGGREKT